MGPKEARSGEAVTYECVTSPSNPPASIQWAVDNVTRSARAEETRTSPSDRSGGWVTRANITVTLGAGDRSKVVQCNAINAEAWSSTPIW